MSHDVSTYIRLTLFGSPQIVRGDGAAVALRSRKHVALLLYLVMEQRRVTSRDTLLGLLWPEFDEQAARNNLRVALADLRRGLGDGAARLLHITRHTVQFGPASDHTLDVLAFRALLDASYTHTHDALDACAACLVRMEQAVALYGGEFLHGFSLPDSSAFEEWALIQREQLHQAALEALHVLAAAYERMGDHAAQCRYARRQIALEPWREQAHVQLMRGLLANGQRGAALEQYHACCRILATELGLSPSQELVALYEQIGIEAWSEVGGIRSEVAASEPALHPASRIPQASATLPAPLTPFVGRTTELDELAELLHAPDTRLLTIVGAGGMGKTRLALELARINLRNYADGVCFVALASLRTADELPATLLHALDLTSYSGDPLAVLVHALADKHMLLVLDNFEQLLDGAALVVELLQAAPRLQIVATSRERLNVRGEQRYLIGGLAYTLGASDADTATLPAVRLFVQSARRIHPRFRLDAIDLAGVLRICQLTLGMPLGLELAAVWVELLPLAAIAAQIERRGDFLSSEVRDLPERQRSMRAVFDWSWRLLRADEKQVFRQLTVFRGGFTLQAAQAVAGASLPTVLRLVEKSLIQVGAGRYTIHELLRQFAAEQLDTAQERTATEQRHSQFFLAFVAQRELRLARHEPLQATAEIHAEIDNIRTAWAWGAAHHALDDLAASAYSLWLFTFFSGLAPEGAMTFHLAAEQIQVFCAQPGVNPPVRRRGQQLLSTLLAFQASLLGIANGYDQALTIAQQAISIGETSGGIIGETMGWFVCAQSLYRQGRYGSARTHAEQALVLTLRYQAGQPTYEILLDLEWRIAIWLRGIAAGLGDYTSAIAHGKRALQLCQAQQRRYGEANSLANLADVAREMRDYPTARAGLEGGLRLARAIRYRWGEGISLLDLGDLVRLLGEYGRASELMLQALPLIEELGDRMQASRAMACLGRLHCFLGDYASAHGWLQQAEQLLVHVASPEARVETYGALTIYALHTGATKQALAYAEQGWQLARDFCNPYTQAQTLVELGHAQAALQRAEAAATYQEALERYEHLGHAALAAEPRAGLALLALAHGDLATAQAHAELLLGVLAEHPHAGLDEPFASYRACYRVLAAVGDPRAATLFHTAQQRLDAYAEQIVDAALRQSFLEQVATHREFVRAR